MDYLERVAAVERLARAASRVGGARPPAAAAARASLLERLRPLCWRTAGWAASLARRRGPDVTVSPEDFFQEAQCILLGLIDRFDPARGDALPYFTIGLRVRVRQLVIARARRQPPGRRVDWNSGPAQALADRLSYRLAQERDGWRRSNLEARLHEALGRLSRRQQRLLWLYYWRDLSDKEIGQALRISTPAASQARYRALAQLRTLLGKQ